MAEPMMTGTDMPSRFRSDEERWAAVLDRNPDAEDAFFYSVATTGVYCRAGCPSRRPRREHVRFHSSCEEAENAGFRACRRCRPNEPSLAERHALAVARACRLIETAEEIPDLDTLADAAGHEPVPLPTGSSRRPPGAGPAATPPPTARTGRGKRCGRAGR